MAPSIISAYAAILASSFSNNPPIIESNYVLTRFLGIDHPPSDDEEAPPPRGLTRKQSKALFKFFETTRQQDVTQRMDFVTKGKWSGAGAVVWKFLFTKVAGTLRQRIDAHLEELEEHPLQVMTFREPGFPSMLSDTCGNIARHHADKLFSDYILDHDGRFTANDAIAMAKTIYTLTFNRHKKTYQRVKAALLGIDDKSTSRKRRKINSEGEIPLMMVLMASKYTHQPAL